MPTVQEKMFSVFETYTEWITKGKMNPSVELGKKLNITTGAHIIMYSHRKNG